MRWRQRRFIVKLDATCGRSSLAAASLATHSGSRGGYRLERGDVIAIGEVAGVVIWRRAVDTQGRWPSFPPRRYTPSGAYVFSRVLET